MGARGQASVEWVAIIGVIALAALGLATVAPSGAWRLGESVLHAIACNAGRWCGETRALERAYGERTAALIRRLAPLIVYERGSAQLPVDFRRCRSTSCADGADRAEPAERSSLGLRVTAFTRVVDQRHHGGALYLQYWLYFPESFTTGIGRRLGPLAKSWPGFHRDDWEGVQLRISPGERVDARATSHGGYRGHKDEEGWAPWTGLYRVSGGSHAGHLVSGPARERSTASAALDLVPLETLPYPDLSRFDVTPPWRKEVYRRPESGSS